MTTIDITRTDTAEHLPVITPSTTTTPGWTPPSRTILDESAWPQPGDGYGQYQPGRDYGTPVSDEFHDSAGRGLDEIEQLIELMAVRLDNVDAELAVIHAELRGIAEDGPPVPDLEVIDDMPAVADQIYTEADGWVLHPDVAAQLGREQLALEETGPMPAVRPTETVHLPAVDMSPRRSWWRRIGDWLGGA